MTEEKVTQNPFAKTRLIMYHKSPTSGRTTFLKQQGQTICAFDALPKLSSVLDKQEQQNDEPVLNHPSPLLQHAAQWLGVAQEDLELEREYCEKVDVSDGPVTVYLARFKTIDPPFVSAERVGSHFISLTDAIGLPPAEMELLRRAYVMIMG